MSWRRNAQSITLQTFPGLTLELERLGLVFNNSAVTKQRKIGSNVERSRQISLFLEPLILSLIVEETQSKAWFPFGLFVPFDARFGFLLPVLVFPAPMSVLTFCCSSLFFAAYRCPLLFFLVLHCS